MSEPFEHALATWTYNRLLNTEVVEGDRFMASFPSESTAAGFSEAMFDVASPTLESVDFEDTSYDVPVFTIDDIPIYFASVRPDSADVSEPYEISRWYASTLRTMIAEDDGSDDALFFVFEEGIEIETLGAVHDLYGEDGRFPISKFSERVQNDQSGLDTPGRAVLNVVGEKLNIPSEPDELLNNLEPLRQYCRLREACQTEDGDQLAQILPDLGRYMEATTGPFVREDLFEDDWFQKTASIEHLEDQVRQILERNEAEAERIDNALGVIKDERSELSAYFVDSFVDRILDAQDWQKEVSREDIQAALADDDNDDDGGSGASSGEEQTNDRSQGSDSASASDAVQVFETLTIEAADSREFTESDSNHTRRHIIATAETEFSLTAKFSGPVDPDLIRYAGPEGELANEPVVDDNSISVSITPTSSDVTYFRELEVYLGHKRRSGTPKFRVSFGIVPEWFFGALQDELYHIDVDEASLVVPTGDPVTLEPADSDADAELPVIDIEHNGKVVTLDGPKYLRPKPPEDVEQLQCEVTIEGAATPIPIQFLSHLDDAVREDVTFPLLLAAIFEPAKWGAEGDHLVPGNSVFVNTSTQQVHSPGRGSIEIQDRDHECLLIEELMVEEETVAPRETTSSSLEAGTPVSSPFNGEEDGLKQAYEDLLQHFSQRDTTPSTDPWDTDTRTRVRAVLDAYLTAIDDISDGTSLGFRSYRSIGTVRSTTTDVTWLTPFHPLMLAYGLQLSNWRASLVEEGKTDGFRFERFRSLLSPAGLLPYRWSSDEKMLLTGQRVGNHHLWAAYSPPSGYGSRTPQYMSAEISGKLEAFAQAFPPLFDIHSDRQIDINLVNMGDLEAVIEGLLDFYRFIDDFPRREPPRINLRIFGGPAEGEAIERFFATDTYSELRDDLESRNNELVDLFSDRVNYLHQDEPFTETKETAHLTFFRGLLDERPGSLDVEDVESGVRLTGLLPREYLRVEANQGGINAQSGIRLSKTSEHRIERVAQAVNALEAGARDSFDRDRTLSRVIQSADRGDLQQVWDQSLWVSHIEPQIGLDFYVKSTAAEAEDGPEEAEDTLMIHYSDQYDSTPGFDVITTTNKRDPYLQALRRELDTQSGLDQVDPNTVLTRLVAIDGELALDIQRAEGNSIAELLGFVGGLAVSSYLLRRDLPDHEWIPISLNEFARHDRQYRRTNEGLLQYFTEGTASDDLCFIGLPKESPASGESLTVKLWIVETKGGTSSISKGVEQVRGARENLRELFHPDQGFADTEILYSEFGSAVQKIASRLYHYGVIDDEEQDALEQHERALLDGEYEVQFLKDANGQIGEVVRIQRDIALGDTKSKDGVRILKLPLETLSVINNPAQTDGVEALDNLNAEFDPDQLESDSLGDESPAEADTEPQSREDSAEGQAETTPVEPTSPTEEASSEQVESSTDPQETDVSGSESEDVDSPAERQDSETDADTDTDDEAPSTADDHTVQEDEGVPSSENQVNGWTTSTYEIVPSLTQTEPTSVDVDRAKLTATIKEQFESLGVNVRRPNPVDVSIGPQKIGVDVHPKEGQKIGGILNNLDSVSVHIQASGTITGTTMPSKGAVRLEIPHGDQQIINLRSVLEAQWDTLTTPLHIPLGVNTENEHIFVDLLEEYHLLVGGATGSGKSNFLSTLIASLALTNDPESVTMSLLDPKGVDFERFASLPHVNTHQKTPEDCATYFQGLLEDEVEQRRNRLQDVGATSVQEYNQLAANRDFDKIDFRVIVIDEFADLMMAVDDEAALEEAVTRLTQTGRALGYSIILATQRPDADIVSGKIKANFNSRIAFELPSGTDSRVILDKNGAEDLQGSGDMIAITQDGTEYHLQAYFLPVEDALTITDRLGQEHR